MNIPSSKIELHWNGQVVNLPIESGRCLYWQKPPAAIHDVTGRLNAVLDQTGTEPPLEQCVIPGDVVAIAVDPLTPALDQILPVVIKRILNAGVEAQDISIVVSLQGKYVTLKPDVTEKLKLMLSPLYSQIDITEHAPLPEENLRYLASTAMSQPVMLNQKLVDADVVITVGISCYDRFYRERGTTSLLYPGFSTQADLLKGTRQGHVELTSGEVFPLKQMADEVGWLLGSVVTLQAIPAAWDNVHDFLWGTNDSVSRKSRQLLGDTWSIPVSQRVESVLLKIPDVPDDVQTEILIECMARARQFVKRGGRLFILCQLTALHPELEALIGGKLKPAEIYQGWSKDSLYDTWKLLARNFLETIEWCHVYLVNQMDSRHLQHSMLYSVNFSDQEWRELFCESESVLILENPLYISSISTRL